MGVDIVPAPITTTTRRFVVVAVAVVSAIVGAARAQEHPLLPAAITAAEVHRLLSEARWPDGSPGWTMPAWLAVEQGLDRYVEARRERLLPLVNEMTAAFPQLVPRRSLIHDRAAHEMVDRVLDLAVALERELFDAVRHRVAEAVPAPERAEWITAIDRAERRRRRSALRPPPRLHHAIVGDVERIVLDVVPGAFEDPVVRELVDRWSIGLDGQLESLARAAGVARERFRESMRRIDVDCVEDLGWFRLGSPEAYPRWLEASASLRSAVAAEVTRERETVDAIAARLDPRESRALVDRWHRITHRLPVSEILDSADDQTRAILSAWSVAELESRCACVRTIERHSPAEWPMAAVSPLAPGLLEALIPALSELARREEARAGSVAALVEAHGTEVTRHIRSFHGVMERYRWPHRWSEPTPFEGHALSPSRLLRGPVSFATFAPESLCLDPPDRRGLEALGRVVHDDALRREIHMVFADALLEAIATEDGRLGLRSEMPIAFLRRPRAEASVVLELLDTEARRSAGQSVLESRFFTLMATLADPESRNLIELVAAARHVDHLLLPTRFVVENRVALGDDQRADANPLAVVAVAVIDARRDGAIAPDAIDAIDAMMDLALDWAPEIERHAALRAAEATAFRREHLPQFMTPSATMPMTARLDRAAARWWQQDAARRRASARLHDECIASILRAAPDALALRIARQWLVDARPTVHGIEPAVRQRIEAAIDLVPRNEPRRRDQLENLLDWLDDRWERLGDEATALLADMPPALAAWHLLPPERVTELSATRTSIESRRRDLAERAAVRLSIMVDGG